MKKIILISTFLISGIIINAQNATPARTASETKKGQKADPETRAKHITARMTKELVLTADQQVKVQKINLEQAKALYANREKFANDKNQFESGKKNILNKWDADLSAVLVADQLTKWEKFKADKKAENLKKSE